MDRGRLLQLLSPIAVLILWELVSWLGWLDTRFFPPPSAIGATFRRLVASGELFGHVAISLQRIFLGFIVGAVPGVVLGLVMGLSSWVRLLLSPLVAATYPIPKSAILPLIMLVFGLGEATKVVTVAIGVFYLVLVNTIAGVVNIEQTYLDVAKNFGASRLQAFTTVALPGALPLIFTGLRLGMGIGMILIAVAEMVGARSGIGFMIWESWQSFSVERMYVGLIVIALLGFVTTVAMEFLERLCVPWKQHPT